MAGRVPPRRGRVVALAGVVLGLAVVAVLVWQLRDTSDSDDFPSLPLPPGADTVVPDVRGLSPWDAADVLARWGLAHGVNEGDPLGEGSRVVAQEPGAGIEVPVGSIVGLRTEDGVTSIRNVGVPVHVDGWVITITDHGTRDRFDDRPPPVGAQWYVVTGLVTNTRDEARELDAPSMIELGYAYERRFVAAAGMDANPQVVPGSRCR